MAIHHGGMKASAIIQERGLTWRWSSHVQPLLQPVMDCCGRHHMTPPPPPYLCSFRRLLPGPGTLLPAAVPHGLREGRLWLRGVRVQRPRAQVPTPDLQQDLRVRIRVSNPGGAEATGAPLSSLFKQTWPCCDLQEMRRRLCKIVSER